MWPRVIYPAVEFNSVMRWWEISLKLGIWHFVIVFIRKEYDYIFYRSWLYFCLLPRIFWSNNFIKRILDIRYWQMNFIRSFDVNANYAVQQSYEVSAFFYYSKQEIIPSWSINLQIQVVLLRMSSTFCCLGLAINLFTLEVLTTLEKWMF